MMTIADEARPKLISSQLVPDVVIVTGQQSMGAVAEVRTEPGAGFDGVPDAAGAGRGVA